VGSATTTAAVDGVADGLDTALEGGLGNGLGTAVGNLFDRKRGRRDAQRGAPADGISASGDRLAYGLCRSRDGLNWEYLPDVAIPFLCDTQNQLVYDPRLSRFVAWYREYYRVQ
jgi:hypothetical protein